MENRSHSIIKKEEEKKSTDIIPTTLKILFSLPSFGKMSSLLILK